MTSEELFRMAGETGMSLIRNLEDNGCVVDGIAIVLAVDGDLSVAGSVAPGVSGLDVASLLAAGVASIRAPDIHITTDFS